MRRLVVCAAGLLYVAVTAYAAAVSSVTDPYVLLPGNGELLDPNPVGFRNTASKTQVSSVLSSPSTTAVVIVTWQSNGWATAAGSYATTEATSYNFNIYDGGLYACSNPALGAPIDQTLSPNGNGIACQIADGLIGGSVYSHVVMVPSGNGGSLCSDWTTGVLAQRIAVTARRLASRNLTAATGFTGDTWILAHGGETDAVAGTAQAPLAACIRSFAQSWADNGVTARFFVPTESMVASATSATVTGAQADAVASGCSTCRQGADVDSLTGANRQADGTHMSETGAANLAAADVTVITNCKNTAC